MSICVLDYGLCNLQSLINALESLGETVHLVDSHQSGATYDRMFIPGVGAFGTAMKEMNKRGLVETVLEHVSAGRPLMGICLGMQLLVDQSVEFGNFGGLGLIAGQTVALDDFVDDSTRVPHIGWNQLSKTANWDSTLLARVVPREDDFYFVHSFVVQPRDATHCLATCAYGQSNFAAVIQKDNIVGVQFHPEKSGKLGIAMLEHFLRH